jgi:hypothetical protein
MCNADFGGLVGYRAKFTDSIGTIIAMTCDRYGIIYAYINFGKCITKYQLSELIILPAE